MTDLPRFLNKVVNLSLQPVGDVYPCPYNFCQFNRPLEGFMPSQFRYHVVNHHSNFYVYPVEANQCEQTEPEASVVYQELRKTDLTDRVMLLTTALAREKSLVAGAGDFELGEQFTYVRVSDSSVHFVLHCCAYCAYRGTNLNDYKRHVAAVHMSVVGLPPGTPEATTTHERYFYL